MITRVLIQPQRGYDALAPEQLQLIKILYSARSKELKSFDMTSAKKVRDAILEGNEMGD